MPDDPLAAARALFSPAPGTVYLDAATYGLPPQPTVEIMHKAVTDWQAGAATWHTDWDQRGEDCRALFATLIGAPTQSISLQPSVSTGVGIVASSLNADDEILVPDDEFTSVAYPLLVVARERGVRLRSVPFADLASSIMPTTTLVAFSLIQSQSGRGAALAEILAAAEANGARTLIDATHAVPFVPLQADTGRVDYLVCAAYKHLLSPRGVAFMYVAEKQWEAVPPLLANWRSTRDPYGGYYGNELDLAETAARFDVSLAWFAWVGASESLRLLVDWQSRGLLEHVVRMARQLAARAAVPEPVGSVVSVPVEDAEAVRDHLARLGVKAAVRAGSVRLAPHVYNTLDDIDRAVDGLMPFVRVAAAR